MRQISIRKDLIAFAILLSVSAVLVYVYFHQVDYPNLRVRLYYQSQIVSGKAQAPWCYRVLVPFFIGILSKVFSQFLPYPKAFLISNGIYDVAAISLLPLILFVYLRLWFSCDQSLIGALFVEGTLVLTLKDHYYQPGSLLEASLFSLGLFYMYRKRYLLLCLVITLAALNRETGLFIPLAFLFTSIDVRDILKKALIPWKSIWFFCGYFCIWLVIFIELRYFLGDETHIHSSHIYYSFAVPKLGELFTSNISANNILNSVVNNSLFLGLFWIFTVLGFRYAPNFIQRATLIVPFYLLAVIIFGAWYEVRYFWTLYPILIPLGLSFIYQGIDSEKPNFVQRQ